MHRQRGTFGVTVGNTIAWVHQSVGRYPAIVRHRSGVCASVQLGCNNLGRSDPPSSGAVHVSESASRGVAGEGLHHVDGTVAGSWTVGRLGGRSPAGPGAAGVSGENPVVTAWCRSGTCLQRQSPVGQRRSTGHSTPRNASTYRLVRRLVDAVIRRDRRSVGGLPKSAQVWWNTGLQSAAVRFSGWRRAP